MTRAEIIALVGKNAKMLNDVDEPVHIIMERVSSKTQDAYVEFFSLEAAMKVVERHQELIRKGRQHKIGDRPVEIRIADQSELMKDLFPLAAGVTWRGAKPEIRESVKGQPWNDFKGFVTTEEMTMLVKHAEAPQRVSFVLPRVNLTLLYLSRKLTCVFLLLCSLLTARSAPSVRTSA